MLLKYSVRGAFEGRWINDSWSGILAFAADCGGDKGKDALLLRCGQDFDLLDDFTGPHAERIGASRKSESRLNS